MSLSNVLLLVLGLSCIVLAMAQMASLGAARLCLVALVLAIALISVGEAASRTSVADLSQWLSAPQRRMDLAALLLIEALIFGNQAIAAVQRRQTLRWKLLGGIPPPSLLIALFLAQVWTMLAIDGIDFEMLAWGCAVMCAVMFSIGASLLRGLLPDPLMRTGLRLWLHGVQVAAGLWLARPDRDAAASPTPAMWDRLGLVAVIVIIFMALGWFWQRRSLWKR